MAVFGLLGMIARISGSGGGSSVCGGAVVVGGIRSMKLTSRIFGLLSYVTSFTVCSELLGIGFVDEKKASALPWFAPTIIRKSV